jgi:ACT domain-containing protein
MSNPALIQIYEDRIQRLEDGVTDVKVDLGVLKSQVTDGFGMLSEKLDVVAVLSERLAVLETKDKISVQLMAQEEGTRIRKQTRRGTTWKVIAGVVTTIVAVVSIILKITLGG